MSGVCFQFGCRGEIGFDKSYQEPGEDDRGLSLIFSYSKNKTVKAYFCNFKVILNIES